MLARPLAALAAAFVLLAAGEAEAREKKERKIPDFSDNFTPTGAVFELLPAVSLCLPTAAAACKTREGSTGPLVGGQFSVGYRPHRNISIGAAYVGSALTLDWNVMNSESEPMNRQFDGFAQIHGGFVWVRPTVGYHRWDFGFEVGGGFSWLSFPMTAPAGHEAMFSRGFSMLLGPTIDVWVTGHVYLGVKADFIMNIQTRVCVKNEDGTKCRDRNKGDDQVPIHQVLPGFHIGFRI